METNSHPAVQLEKVFKEIKKRLILEDVSLEVPAGKTYGIQGHNGAGKSILLRVIAGLVLPSSGSVSVFGERIGRDVEFPRDIGALIETPGFLPQYSGFTNLQLLAMIRKQITDQDIKATIRRVGLDPGDKRPVRTYSTGMKQRLGLAQAMMEKPGLLLLDEPTNGLDVQGIRDVHQLLKELHEQGVTIILTSHSRDEIETLCEAAFVIEGGRLSHPSYHT